MANEIRISFFNREAITQIIPARPIMGVYPWWIEPILPFRLLTIADLPNLTPNTVLKIKFGMNPRLGYIVGSDFIFVNRAAELDDVHGRWKYYFQNNYISSHNTLETMITASQIYTNLPVPAVAPVAAGLPDVFHLNNLNRDITAGPNPRPLTDEENLHGCSLCFAGPGDIVPPNTKLYLGCGHTFCGNCVNDLDMMLGVNRNKCPICAYNIIDNPIYTRPQLGTVYFLVGGKKQLGGGKKRTSKKQTSKKRTSKKQTSKKQTSKKRTSKKQTGGRKNSKKGSKKSSKRTSKKK